MEGQVIAVDDPDQMGRVKVWVPQLDGDEFDVEWLPWTEYVAPLGGFTVEHPGGANSRQNFSSAAYGIWAIPKIGATVLVFCMNGDPDKRFYMGATFRLHRNRSLPAGRNLDAKLNRGPHGDSGDADGTLIHIEPAYSNLREQFQGRVGQAEAQSRGVYERQVAQASFEKDGIEGYAKSPLDGETYLDPQTYCWVTPGRHAIIMQDSPDGARMRLKTGEGHQVIFDDANERIYVSTAKGKTWIELDQDGHIHIFGSQSVSVRAGKDINLTADKNVNIEAGGAINMKSLGGDVRISSAASFELSAVKNIVESACGIFDMSAEKSIKITTAQNLDIKSDGNIVQQASANVDIKAGGNMKQTAKKVDINGPSAKNAEPASCAKPAGEPPIVPGHEPWTRPSSSTTRGPNWKP